MAVLALAAAGAALAPTGYAAIGWTVGQVVGQLLFPGKSPDQVGPRIGDLRAQQSAYGVTIPIVYGTMRVAGNVIWSTDLIETVNTQTRGGKGGPSHTQRTFSYRVSMAVMLGEGPITGVRKIWANGTLIFNVEASADLATVMASNASAQGITIYLGSTTQLADPTMQAALGVANVPAYRGRAYVVFTDLQLVAFSDRRPNITAEVVGVGSTTSTQSYSTPPGFTFISYDSIATDGSIFIAVDRGTARYARSADAQTWGPITNLPASVPAGNGFCIAWGNGTWVIGTGSAIASSTDGINWIAILSAAGAPTGPRSVVWNGSLWLIIGPNLTWATSPDGLIWTSQNVPIIRDWRSCCWTGVRWVVIATTGETAYGPDGFAWTIGALPGGSDNVFIDASPNHMVVVRSSNALGARSVDGITWTSPTLPAGGYNAVRWAGSYYVAVRGGALLNAYARSFDGITWTGFDQSQVFNMTALAVRAGTAVVVNNQQFPDQRAITLRFDVLTPGGIALSSVVSDLCIRAGLLAGDIDVTALTDLVDGYAVGQQISARAAIEPLQRAFYFDAIESDNKIVFRKRGGASVLTITNADLAARAFDDALPEDVSITRQQEVELPSRVNVVYINNAADYQQATQQSQRQTTLSKQQMGVELAISMTDAKAKQIADVLMYDAWTQRVKYRIQLSRKYAALEPADVVTLVRPSSTTLLRIQGKRESRSGVIELEAVAEEASVYTQSAPAGASLVPPSTVRSAPTTLFAIVDAPALRDQDNDQQVYAAAGGFGAGWRGAVIYRSSDSGASYDEWGALTAESAIGYATSVLPTFTGRNIFDETNLVNIALECGSISSTTQLAVLNGANAMLIGAELVQFTGAFLFRAGEYQLSGLLRGRRGTEHAMTTHVIGERVVLLTASALRRYQGDLNLARTFKPVSIGRTVQETVAQSATYTGVNLRCLAPVLLGAGRDSTGAMTINWTRRTRIGGEWLDSVDAQLGEPAQTYELEIWNPGFTILRRTVTALVTPTYAYSTAFQTADSYAVFAAVSIRVFQISAVTGRGYVAQGIV